MFYVPIQDWEVFGPNDTHYWMLKAAGFGICFGSDSCQFAAWLEKQGLTTAKQA